ncbi:MAG: hypothetical protein D3923_13780 [Candidatus Electrothrix sp. AR3]|nr:hypothetical protein [Candidatus Electrothrix sp. AR3]
MLTVTEGPLDSGMMYKSQKDIPSTAYPAAPSEKEFQSMLDFQPPKHPELQHSFQLYQESFSQKEQPKRKKYYSAEYRSGVLDGLLFYFSVIPTLQPRYSQGTLACDHWLSGLNCALALHSQWLNARLSATFRAINGEPQ